MQDYQTNTLLRPNTLLGVCEAIGEDFGFNANWLRVAFALPMFAMPLVTVTVYLALGLVVLATRLAWPNPRVTSEAAGVTETEVVERDYAFAA